MNNAWNHVAAETTVAMFVADPLERKDVEQALKQASFKVLDCLSKAELKAAVRAGVVKIFLDVNTERFDTVAFARQLFTPAREPQIFLIFLLPRNSQPPEFADTFLEHPVAFYARPARIAELSGFARKFFSDAS